MIHSPHYLKTVWTRMEYWFAMAKKSPIAALMPDGILIGQSAPQWPWKSVDMGLPGCTFTGQTLAKPNRCTIRPPSTLSDCPLCMNKCLEGRFTQRIMLLFTSSGLVCSSSGYAQCLLVFTVLAPQAQGPRPSCVWIPGARDGQGRPWRPTSALHDLVHAPTGCAPCCCMSALLYRTDAYLPGQLDRTLADFALSTGVGLFVPKPSTDADCQRRSIPGLRQTVRGCPLASTVDRGDCHSLCHSIAREPT